MNKREAYIKDPTLVYNDKCTRRRIVGDEFYEWKKKFGEVIPRIFNIDSIIDLGCSVGPFIDGALQGGAKKVLGIDVAGNFAVKYCVEQLRDKIVCANLGKPLQNDYGKWDCALSVETAEHLLPEEADTFVDNLVKVAGKIIVFSASPKSSNIHLNPQKPEYWKEKIESRGPVYSNSKTDILAWYWQMAYHEWQWQKGYVKDTCKNIRVRLHSLMVFDVWN
jgi:hypothetical protein